MRRFSYPSGLAAIALLVFALLLQGCSHSPDTNASAAAPSTAPAVASFTTPEAALAAFVAAMRNNDQASFGQLLGDDADELVSSGDPVADQQARERFLQEYDSKHQLVPNAAGDSVTLLIGEQDWPLPIPIVKDEQTGRWSLDADAGKEEILNRRIGRNELNVIRVCEAIIDAQQEYARRDPNGDGVPAYATRFISTPGQRDGLYWETSEGEPPSPLGALAADASAEGYSATRPAGAPDGPRPYHGYLYRILTAQGPHAPGGAMDYMIKGQLIGGFAVVAWPAQYGNSGIMTFLVNHTGVVYQKDLGEETDKIARAMTLYDPDPTWKSAE